MCFSPPIPHIDRPLICSTASKIGHLLPSKSVSLCRSSTSCAHLSLSFRSLQNSYSEKYERKSTTPSPLTLISRLKNDKSLSSAHLGNVSKTLKNSMNIAVVNVKSSKSVSVALEVACEFSFPSPFATHLPIVEKSGSSTLAGRPHRMSLHVLDPSLNVPSTSTLRVCPSGSFTQKQSSSLAMFNMRGTFSIVPLPSSPAWTNSGISTFI